MPTKTKAHPITNAVAGAMAKDDELIDVVVGLKIRNPDKLDSLVAAQSTPNDPRYGQWLVPEDVMANYAPAATDAKAIIIYLGNKGFTNIQLSNSRLLISATGILRVPPSDAIAVSRPSSVPVILPSLPSGWAAL